MTNNQDQLIQEFINLHSIPDIADWIKKGKETHSFINPPKIDSKSAIDFYDSLEEIASEKITEILARKKTLEKEHKQRLNFLNEHILHQAARMVLMDLDAAYYQEYFFLNKWLSYWYSMHKVDSISTKSDRLTELDILKAKEYPLEDLFLGDLKRSGNKLAGLCPFHNEDTPSFYIFPENTFHCFGCGEHGDAISFFMKTRDVGFVKAVERIRDGHF